MPVQPVGGGRQAEHPAGPEPPDDRHRRRHPADLPGRDPDDPRPRVGTLRGQRGGEPRLSRASTTTPRARGSSPARACRCSSAATRPAPAPAARATSTPRSRRRAWRRTRAPRARRRPTRRGLVAMAKSSQPGSTGSQFFLVYGDSALPPEYSVVGRIGTAGPGGARPDRRGRRRRLEPGRRRRPAHPRADPARRGRGAGALSVSGVAPQTLSVRIGTPITSDHRFRFVQALGGGRRHSLAGMTLTRTSSSRSPQDWNDGDRLERRRPHRRVHGRRLGHRLVVGRHGTRDDFLSYVRSGALGHTRMEGVGERRVRVYGDTAVLVRPRREHGAVRRRGHRRRRVDVRRLRPRDGRWRCALTHITPVAPTS